MKTKVVPRFAFAALFSLLTTAVGGFAQTTPVSNPVAPAVEIYTPTNGATFYADADIQICADVTGGVPTTVGFYAGTNLLGVVTNSPIIVEPAGRTPPTYPLCLTWSNVPPGAYSLTAVADVEVSSTGAAPVIVTEIVTSAPVNITVSGNPPPPPPPLVAIQTPTAGATFRANSDIQICAAAGDTNGGVAAVEFFAGATSLGVSSNFAVIDPIAGRPILYYQYFCFSWTNVPPGVYDLTAVAVGNDGLMGTSAPVSITVAETAPPPPPPTVAITTPANGTTFFVDSDIEICATANDGTGTVASVEFLAGTNILGVVTNDPVTLPPGVGAYIRAYCLTWSNVPPGDYTLTAIATDNSGLMGTSAPVNIMVSTNTLPPPAPVVMIESPANGAIFRSAANIEICASGRDPNGQFVTTEFFEGTNSLGIVTNYPVVPIEPVRSIIYSAACLTWSNVPPGGYVLTAVGTDNNGLMVTSASVDITVLAPPPPPTNLPPVVSIYAPDPIAVAGTNFLSVTPVTAAARYCGGTNTATFLVLRRGDTNADLTVYYAIGGTASNGVDYVTIPNNVTIAAGQDYALITIIPLVDIDPAWRPFDTIVLGLQPSPVTASSYTIGSPSRAGAIILEDDCLPPVATTVTNLPDCTFHLCMPGTNGLNYCLQVTTNLVDWTSVCTNTVVKGAIDFIDPDACDIPNRFYRVISVAGPTVY